MRANEIPTNETLRFVLQNLPQRKNQRILEIGCGNGELAKRLTDAGREVIAIDSSEESIANAKQLGVDARLARFPDFEESPFDTILFSRSLHHICPLAAGIHKARKLMTDQAVLIVEDFAFEETTVFAAGWFYGMLKLLDLAGAVAGTSEDFGRRVLEGQGSRHLWSEHAHDSNTAKEIRSALKRARFQILSTENVPYFYRYLTPMVADTNDGREIVANVLSLERAMGAQVKRFLIGRRLVAML